MKVKTIELCGYSSYKDLTVIDIPDGITGIVGVYDDEPSKSNGSGKTSLVMSIIYALYGEGESNNIQEYVNDQSDTMYVKLYFELNSLDYLIERGINKKLSYLDFYQLDGENKIRIGNDIRNTQDEINKLIGMTYDMLSASNFFEQMNMDKFVNTAPATRRSYLDKVLNLEKWREAAKNVAKDVKDNEKDIETSKSLIKEYNEYIKELSHVIKDKKTVEESIQALIEEKQEIQKYLKEASENKKILEEIKIKETKIENEENNISNVDTKITAIEKNIINIKKEIESHSSINIDEYKIQYDIEINKKNNLLKSYREKLSENIKNKNSLSTKVAILHTNISHKEKEKLKIITGTCPTCKQIVDTNLLKLENEKINKEIEFIKQDLDKYSTKETELTQEDIYTNKIINTLEKQIEEINTNFSELKDNYNKNIISFSNKKTTLLNLTASLEELKIDKKKSLLSILHINSEIHELQYKLTNKNFNENLYSVKTKELESINTQINKLSVELGLLIEKNKTFDEINKNLIIETEKLLIFKETKLINDSLLDIFINIPRKIFNDSISLIEDNANEIIHQIIPNLSVKIKEDIEKKNFPIMIEFEKNGKKRSYKRLSGGQKTIANIGIRLGFSKVISMQTQTNIRFIVLDEPFSALDEENRSLIKKVLTLVSEYFNQIIIITHTEDTDNFPNIITVKMTENETSYIN